MMNTEDFFILKKPQNLQLHSVVDTYFFIDTTKEKLAFAKEYVLPFPRITFGYFFDSPFMVTNHSKNESFSSNMIISRISTDKIFVEPQFDRIKIIGAHIQPFGLAFLTDTSIRSLPWLINTKELFKNNSILFLENISSCNTPDEMFEEVEKIFLKGMLMKDLSLIQALVNIIDEHKGNILISDIAKQFKISEKTIRNQFYSKVGCSPKTYIRLVKLRQIAQQMKYSENILTDIAYENHYFDQAHFIHEVKDITGKSPNKLRKEIPGFRFLQF